MTKPRKKGIGPEDKIHLAFGQIIQKYQFYNKLKVCAWTYFPAGELRTHSTGVLLKKKGLQRGFPDYLFIKPEVEGNAEMIWLEFKAEKGTQSEHQINFQVSCDLTSNMRYYLPRSVEEGVKILEKEGILITQ